MKIFDTKAKKEEKVGHAYDVLNVINKEENLDIVDIGESAIDDLEKVAGTSNEIKQQSIPKALFVGNKNIKALAENDVVISKVLKNVLDWLLLVTSASTIRREEYEDLTNQMLKFEDDLTMQMEMQVKFKRAFEQILRKQQEQNKLLKQLAKMKIWCIVSAIVSVAAFIVAMI